MAINENIFKTGASGTSETYKMVKMLDAKQNLELARSFRKYRDDAEWIALNREGLRRKHGDKYVAVRNERVCISDKNLTRLLKKVKKKYRKQAPEVVIDYVGKKKVKFVI